MHSLQTLPWKLETEETAGTRGEVAEKEKRDC